MENNLSLPLKLLNEMATHGPTPVVLTKVAEALNRQKISPRSYFNDPSSLAIVSIWNADPKVQAWIQRIEEARQIRELVMRGYETARQLLEEHRGSVRALAEELLLNESVDAEGIRTVLGSAGVTEPAAAMVATTGLDRM